MATATTIAEYSDATGIVQRVEGRFPPICNKMSKNLNPLVVYTNETGEEKTDGIGCTVP